MLDAVENDVIEQRINNKKYFLGYEDGEYAICCIETDENGKETDRVWVKNITPNQERAKKLFEKIIKGEVSACHLYDVIYDFIC